MAGEIPLGSCQRPDDKVQILLLNSSYHWIRSQHASYLCWQSCVNNGWCLVLIKRLLVALHPWGGGGTGGLFSPLCNYSNHCSKGEESYLFVFLGTISLLNLHHGSRWLNMKGIHCLLHVKLLLFVTPSLFSDKLHWDRECSSTQAAKCWTTTLHASQFDFVSLHGTHTEMCHLTSPCSSLSGFSLTLVSHAMWLSKFKCWFKMSSYVSGCGNREPEARIKVSSVKGSADLHDKNHEARMDTENLGCPTKTERMALLLSKVWHYTHFQIFIFYPRLQ